MEKDILDKFIGFLSESDAWTDDIGTIESCAEEFLDQYIHKKEEDCVFCGDGHTESISVCNSCWEYKVGFGN